MYRNQKGVNVTKASNSMEGRIFQEKFLDGNLVSYIANE